MATISYTKRISIAKAGVAIALFLFGVIVFGNGYDIGGLFFCAIGTSLSTTEGAEIDTEAKKIRRIKSAFGIKFGSWKQYPQFEYVSVFRTRETTSLTFASASAKSKSAIIVVNVFYNTNRHFTIYSTTDTAAAFKVAAKLHHALSIDVLDATGTEKKWL